MRKATAVGLIGVVLAAPLGCGGNGESASGTGPLDLGTVPMGELPEPLSTFDVATTQAATEHTSTTQAIERLDVGDAKLVNFVDGNRVLLVGDSVLAAASPRNGGLLCPVLPNRGWRVELAAVEDKHVDFGHTVFDALLGEDPTEEEAAAATDGVTTTAAATTDVPSTANDFDSANSEVVGDYDIIGIFLGNNFDGDLDSFKSQYDLLIARAGNRPVIVYTPTAINSEIESVADYVRWVAVMHDNVRLVDWDEISRTESDVLLADDGVHLSVDGAGRVVLLTAAALGEFTGFGGCLDEAFTESN